jgi:hypothetical protein
MLDLASRLSVRMMVRSNECSSVVPAISQAAAGDDKQDAGARSWYVSIADVSTISMGEPYAVVSGS